MLTLDLIDRCGAIEDQWRDELSDYQISQCDRLMGKMVDAILFLATLDAPELADYYYHRLGDFQAYMLK